MSVKVITGPAVEPISVAEAKAHCRVDHADEDAWFAMAIASARLAAEHELGRKLIEQTCEVVYDAFPPYSLELPVPRVLAITSVKYIDTLGTLQTLAPEAYVLDADTMPGWALPASGYAWPDTKDTANAVRVRFTAGYGAAASDVPAAVRQWMLMHVGTAHKMRESIAHGVPVAEIPNRYVSALLDGERTWRV